MNYYERHLGDYAKDAGHLSMLEDGAYQRLLDRYYATEQGIPADQAHRVARARTEDEKAAVDAVLAEFFKLNGGVWVNQRAEEEIEKARVKIKAAQENGKKGGRPPKRNPEETDDKPAGFPVGSENETQQKALQSPVSTETDRQTDAPVPESLTVGGIMQTCIEAGARLNPADLHVRQVAGEIVSIGATAEDLREAIRKAQLAKQGKAWGLPYVRVIVGEVVEKRKNLATGGPERPAGGNGEAGGASRKLSLGERATLARQQAEAAEAQREAYGEPLGAHEPPLRAQVVERVR